MRRVLDLRGHALGILSAAAGAAAGLWVFDWMYGQGFYAIMLPGILVGFGGGAFLRRRSWSQGTFCGLAALGAGLFTEWSRFHSSREWTYFLVHARDLRPATWLLIAGGTAFGFWLGQGWRGGPLEEDLDY